MLKIGATIEVKHRRQKGVIIQEYWRLGTICFLNDWQIGVRFKEGDELTVARDRNGGAEWR